MIRIFFVCLIMLINLSLSAQNVIYSENFESGKLPSGLRKIARYPDMPEVIMSDLQFSEAFPPPSGKYVARCRDKNKQFYGLGSVVAGPLIDLLNSSSKNISIEAKLFLLPSSAFNSNNIALLAITDLGGTEKYYRFGYANNSIYFHYFNGSTFSESLYDPDLAKKLKIPGWHTFIIRFSNSYQINFFVDGQETAFSPLIQKDLNKIQLGALMFDKENSNPLFVDDLKIINFGEQALPPPKDLIVSTDTTSQFSKEKTTSSFAQNDISGSPQSQINWMTNLQETGRIANETQKKILIFFYCPAVEACSKLERETLSDPQAFPYLSKFVTVKINALENKEFADRLDIFKLPTLLLVDNNLQIYWRRIGYCTPQDLQNLLYYK